MPLLSKLPAKVGTISLVEFKKSILCEISPKMDNKIITCVSEHELVTDDNIVLHQVKSQETEKDDPSVKINYSHTRSIIKDGETSSYCVKMTVIDGKPSEKIKETNLSDDKLKEFEAEWNENWNSVLDKNS